MYDKAKPQQIGGSYHNSEDKEDIFNIVCPQGLKTKIFDMKENYANLKENNLLLHGA